MIRLKPLPDDVSILDQSHIFRGARLILTYAAEHGPIPLTPSKAFKRVFVNRAARAFVWPQWTVEDFYRVNKVLNEYDFGPLEVLHHVLFDMNRGPHFKGRFRITKLGQALLADPPALFAEIQPYFLFSVSHAHYSRSEEQTFNDWEAALNIQNVDTENGVSLDSVFGVAPRSREQQWHTESELYTGILRPVCWAGLLNERRSRGGGLAAHTYQKTWLWGEVFTLKTDNQVRWKSRH